MTIQAKDGLRYTAAEKGYSLSSVAKLAGITKVQMLRIASGENTSPDTAGKIAHALGYTVIELFHIRKDDPQEGK